MRITNIFKILIIVIVVIVLVRWFVFGILFKLGILALIILGIMYFLNVGVFRK